MLAFNIHIYFVHFCSSLIHNHLPFGLQSQSEQQSDLRQEIIRSEQSQKESLRLGVWHLSYSCRGLETECSELHWTDTGCVCTVSVHQWASILN